MCKEPHVCEGAEMLRDYIYGTEHSAPHCMCSLSESVLLCFFFVAALTHCLCDALIIQAKYNITVPYTGNALYRRCLIQAN